MEKKSNGYVAFLDATKVSQWKFPNLELLKIAQQVYKR